MLLSLCLYGALATIGSGCGGAYDDPVKGEPSGAGSNAKGTGRAEEEKPAEEDSTNTIHLSAGVALPQSLPTGTAMGVSVDYTFVGGRPKPSDSYFWVIEPAKGEPVMQPAPLTIQGTLSGFITQLRPEQGPFRTHIVDGSGKRLSKSVPLQR